MGTVFAVALALVALGWGFITFRQAESLQDEAAATAALQAYVQLRASHPNINYYSQANAKRKGWIGLAALATAETIYLGMPRDDGWEHTAAEIIKDNKGFVTVPWWTDAKWFDCDYYNPEFIAFIRDTVKEAVECD